MSTAGWELSANRLAVVVALLVEPSSWLNTCDTRRRVTCLRPGCRLPTPERHGGVTGSASQIRSLSNNCSTIPQLFLRLAKAAGLNTGMALGTPVIAHNHGRFNFAHCGCPNSYMKTESMHNRFCIRPWRRKRNARANLHDCHSHRETNS